MASALVASAAKDIARFQAEPFCCKCHAALRPKGVRHGVTCPKCGCRFCDAKCFVDKVCNCFVDDLRLIATGDSLRRLTANIDYLTEQRPIDSEFATLWKSFFSCPLRVVLARAVIVRWDAMDTLLALPDDDITSTLSKCGFYGSIDSPLARPGAPLPCHMVVAAAFSRDVLLHHGATALRVFHIEASASRERVFGMDPHALLLNNVLFNLVLHITQHRTVDRRMAAVYVPLLARGVSCGMDPALLASFAGRVFVWILVQDDTFREWALLRDVVRTCPQCCDEFFQGNGARAVVRALATCAAAPAPAPAPHEDPRHIVAFLESIVLAGFRRIQEHVTRFRAVPIDGAGNALTDVTSALELVAYISNRCTTASTVHSTLAHDALFHQCADIMTSLLASSRTMKTEDGARFAIVFGSALAGTDPIRCAVAAPMLAGTFLILRTTTERGYDAPLLKLVVQTMAHAKGGPAFPSDFDHTLCRILCSPGNAELTAHLAQAIATRQRGTDLCIAVIERARKAGLNPVVLSLLLQYARLCGNALCSVGFFPNKRALRLCSRCRCVRYCARACQAADWPLHKRRCNDRVLCHPTRELQPMWTFPFMLN